MIDETIDITETKPFDDVYSNSTIQATIQIIESLVTLIAIFTQAHHWSYKLDNDYYPTIVNEGNHVEIENVTYGNYVLLVYALDNDDNVLATDVVHFNVDYGILHLIMRLYIMNIN